MENDMTPLLEKELARCLRAGRRALPRIGSAPAPKNAVTGFFNSSFMVTVVGGVFLGAITHVWQEHSRATAATAALFDSRKTALAEFVNRFSRSSYLGKQLVHRALWLRFQRVQAGSLLPATSTAGKEIAFVDGKSMCETDVYCDELTTQYYASGDTDALCSTLATYFPDAKLRADIRVLRKHTNQMMGSSNDDYPYPEIGENSGQSLLEQYKAAIASMEQRFADVQSEFQSVLECAGEFLCREGGES
jgi:hypothetical protein